MQEYQTPVVVVTNQDLKTQSNLVPATVDNDTNRGTFKVDQIEIPSIKPQSEKDAFIIAKVAGVEVLFFIDSGAQVNTLTKACFDKILTSSENIFDLKYSTDKPLKGYASSTTIQVIATFSANLFISDDRPVLTEKFYVVNETRSLLGFNTASRYSVLVVGLNVPVVENASWPCELNINKIDCLSSEKFPMFNIAPVSLRYNKDIAPARNIFTHIPPAFKDKTKSILQELLSSGIIEKVTDSMDRSFCSSLLVVPKGKDDIRLVIDLRGPNKCIFRTPFKMPTFESIIMELHGAKYFSTIDLTSAFHHVPIAEDSRHLTNFFAGDTMYRYCRLPFGLCNAPDIFQEIMQTDILAGCEGVVNYLDDVLVFGETQEEHDKNLQEGKFIIVLLYVGLQLVFLFQSCVGSKITTSE